MPEPRPGTDVSAMSVEQPQAGAAQPAQSQTKQELPTIDVQDTGATMMPTVSGGGSAMQEANPEFVGLDSIASFMPYFVIDGTEILDKTDDTIHPFLDVVLVGGKPVWQLWDLNSNLVAESFDGVKDSTTNRPMQELLAEEREKAGAEAKKINIQARYEVYFNWEFADGTKLAKMSLSPSSKYNFAAYTKELTKAGKRLEDVTTRIGAERTVSRNNQRYSRATFTAV